MYGNGWGACPVALCFALMSTHHDLTLVCALTDVLQGGDVTLIFVCLRTAVGNLLPKIGSQYIRWYGPDLKKLPSCFLESVLERKFALFCTWVDKLEGDQEKQAGGYFNSEPTLRF